MMENQRKAVRTVEHAKNAIQKVFPRLRMICERLFQKAKQYKM